MDKKLKQKWVDALRSREYKQGHGWLRKGNEYCCLGVLCDVNYGPEVWQTDQFDHGDGAFTMTLKRDKTILLKCALDPIAPELGLPIEVMDDLIKLNDGGESFDEIANFIEAEL